MTNKRAVYEAKYFRVRVKIELKKRFEDVVKAKKGVSEAIEYLLNKGQSHREDILEVDLEASKRQVEILQQAVTELEGIIEHKDKVFSEAVDEMVLLKRKIKQLEQSAALNEYESTEDSFDIDAFLPESTSKLDIYSLVDDI